MSTDIQPAGRITSAGIRFVMIWAAGLLVAYLAAGLVGVAQLRSFHAETAERRAAWLTAATATPEAGGSPVGAPVRVSVGIGLNRIGDFDLRAGTWTADFDLWLRWRGDDIQPGESFDIVNGETLSREKLEGRVVDGQHVERYRVSARLTKPLDPARFPFSDEGLLIQIEDEAHDVGRLRYVEGGRGGSVAQAVLPPGLVLKRSVTAVTSQRYAFGVDDSEAVPSGAAERSRYVLALLVQPPSLGIYLRMYQALFASVALALVAFFIKPLHVDPRFGLGIGAFFAAIGNNVFLSAVVPAGGGISLNAMINGAGLITIFLTVVQSAISLHVLDTLGQARLSRLFDRVSFGVFVSGYALINVAWAVAATP